MDGASEQKRNYPKVPSTPGVFLDAVKDSASFCLSYVVALAEIKKEVVLGKTSLFFRPHKEDFYVKQLLQPFRQEVPSVLLSESMKWSFRLEWSSQTDLCKDEPKLAYELKDNFVYQYGPSSKSDFWQPKKQ